MERPDVILLIIVDGLSYYDLPSTVDSIPCLVSGISITNEGYLSVVGDPPIVKRLFALGYTNQIAFTYFPASENELSSEIHRLFSSRQVFTFKDFDEILENLDKINYPRLYIQIVLSGLDQLAHKHRDIPPIDAYIEDILLRYDQLIDKLSSKYDSLLGILTADHGIVWSNVIDGDFQVIHEYANESAKHPRYLDGALNRDYTKVIWQRGRPFSMLKFPYSTRKLRRNERGLHGGLSAWESIVPILIRQL